MPDLNLSKLLPGQKVRVKEISEEEVCCKLYDLGVFPGEELTFKKAAPLGDPLLFSFSGSFISIGRAEAGSVSCHPNPVNPAE